MEESLLDDPIYVKFKYRCREPAVTAIRERLPLTCVHWLARQVLDKYLPEGLVVGRQGPTGRKSVARAPLETTAFPSGWEAHRRQEAVTACHSGPGTAWPPPAPSAALCCSSTLSPTFGTKMSPVLSFLCLALLSFLLRGPSHLEFLHLEFGHRSYDSRGLTPLPPGMAFITPFTHHYLLRCLLLPLGRVLLGGQHCLYL